MAAYCSGFLWYKGIFSYFDWTWILIPGSTSWDSCVSFMKSAVAPSQQCDSCVGQGKRYSMHHTAGCQCPRCGIGGVQGKLTDHYDPSSKTVGLAEESYGRTSLAAVGIAAHECGHAIQDAESYTPLKVRSAIVPAS